MAVYLKDLPAANPEGYVDHQANLAAYIALPEVAILGWPVAVVEQWLFDHGHHPQFLDDYSNLELSGISWGLEDIPTSELQLVDTGPSEQSFLRDVAENHRHWLAVRSAEIRDAWDEQGTWLVPPILIAGALLGQNGHGLQLVEGRMRVGILQGRLAGGLTVAESHRAWVGR